jgi:hypothetical protein
MPCISLFFSNSFGEEPNITTGRLCGKMIKGLRLSCLWQIPPFNRFRAVSEVELPEAGKSKRKRI